MCAGRAQPNTHIRKWDMALLTTKGLAMVTEYIVASLDVRFGWSPQLPLVLQIM